MSPASSGDPWRRSGVSELQDQVLPRWFVVLLLAAIPIAVGVAIAAFVVFGPTDVPVAARRPPPEGGFSNAVGEVVVGSAEPLAVADACALIDGLRVAGTDVDRTALREGVVALCDIDVPQDAGRRVARFARDGGVVRFAAFERTGVDSTLQLDSQLLLVNNRFARTEPTWIAPLLAHDTTFLELDPAQAASALAAREAELAVCRELFAQTRAPRGCMDAEELLGLADPRAALGDAGFR